MKKQITPKFNFVFGNMRYSIFLSLFLFNIFISILCAEAQTVSWSNHSQIPDEIQKQTIFAPDTSIQLVHPEFWNMSSSKSNELQNTTNLLKNAKLFANAENIILQTKDFKVSYEFALYDTTLVVKFITSFEIEVSNNSMSFYFDLNSNGKIDSNIDKGFNFNSNKSLCLNYIISNNTTSFCGVPPTKAWIASSGNIKSISYNIPVKEISTQKFISFNLWTNYGGPWPTRTVGTDNFYDFSKVYTIEIPGNISSLATVLTKDVSEITQNSCLLSANVVSSGSNVVNESGIVWAKNEPVTLENNMGRFINESGLKEFNVRLNGLTSNTQYFYRAYAIINNVLIYGKLISFRTEIDYSQFASIDNNILVSNSGKSVIALISEEDFNKFRVGALDLKSISTPLYSKINDDFDFVFLIANSNEFAQAGIPYGSSRSVSNNVKGIGKSEFDISNYYGATGRLKSFIWLPIRSLFKTGPTLHEMMHTWANFLFDSRALVNDNTSPNGLKEIKYGAGGGSHWGVSSAGGQLGGFEKLITNVDGESNKYQGAMNNRIWSGYQVNANGGNGLAYSNLELYLMGLIPPEEVVPVKFFYKLSAKNPDEFYSEGKFYSDSVVSFDAEKIMKLAGGPRVPDFKTSQKEFKALVVLVSHNMPTNDELDELDSISTWFSNPNYDNENSLFNFYEATLGKATLKIGENIKSLKPTVTNAGSDQIVNEGTIVALDGSVKNPLNGKSYTFKWTAPSGITLSSSTDQKPTFTAPEVTKETQSLVSG